MILVGVTILLVAAMALNHAVHGFGCWGLQPGGRLSAIIYDLQILAALIGLLWLLVSLSRRMLPCNWLQLIAIAVFGLASAAAYLLFGWAANTSIHMQGPENLLAFLTVASTTYLIGRYGGNRARSRFEPNNSQSDSSLITPKPRGRWFQFSLRTLLVLVLICSIPCGWFAQKLNQVRQERRAVIEIERLGGEVRYDWDTMRTEPPAWLQRWLGSDFFRTVVEVSFKGLNGRRGTDAGLRQLNRLSQLHTVKLWGSDVTDAGLVNVKGLRQLQQLHLQGTQITDAGLEHLSELTRLRTLGLGGTRITDAGLVNLRGLTKLEYLNLSDTYATDAGIAELQKTLPNCKITR